MFLFVLSLITSFEFPVCAAPGDQLYPDVCWDGEAFWVVWQDGRGELSEIYSAKVKESGSTREPYSLQAADSNLYYPRITYSTDTFLLTFWVDIPDYYYSFYGFNIFDNTGKSYWNLHKTMSSPYSLAVDPMIPIRCKEHFALLYTTGYDATIEFPMSGVVSLLEGEYLHEILRVPPIQGIYPPMSLVKHGAWNGDKLLCFTSNGFIWLDDSLNQNPAQGGYFYPRDSADFWSVIAMTAKDDKIGMIRRSETADVEYYFDLLDNEGCPIFDNPLLLDYQDNMSWYRPTSMEYGSGRYIAVSEARNYDPPFEWGTIWGAEIDSNVALINEGFIYAGPSEELCPDICFGSNHFLMVWADDRSGDWDIYGRILDSLEYSGISESPVIPSSHPAITVDKQVFSDDLTIRFSSPLPKGTVVEIRDAAGRTVRNIRLDFGKTSCIWDGLTSEGSPAGAGVYFIRSDDLSCETVKVVKF